MPRALEDMPATQVEVYQSKGPTKATNIGPPRNQQSLNMPVSIEILHYYLQYLHVVFGFLGSHPVAPLPPVQTNGIYLQYLFPPKLGEITMYPMDAMPWMCIASVELLLVPDLVPLGCASGLGANSSHNQLGTAQTNARATWQMIHQK